MKKIVLTLFLVVLFVSCGDRDFVLDDPTQKQPQVLFVMPDNQWKIPPETSFYIQFSSPVDPQTVNEKTIYLLPEETLSSSFENGKDLEDDLEDKSDQNVEVDYQWISEDDTSLILHPQRPLEENHKYSIIVTTQVLTLGRLPLNQTLGESPTPYLKVYEVGFVSEAISTPLENPDPIVPEGNINDHDGGEEQEEEYAPPVSLQGKLVLNEIFYDAAGSETDGQLFIELKGEGGLSLNGVQVVLINGNDGRVTDTIKITEQLNVNESGLFVIADTRTGSSEDSQVTPFHFLDNFDPQNGPDCVQLFDGTGALIDSVAYGAGGNVMAGNDFACGEGEEAPDASAGQSISRREGDVDTDNNATDFVINLSPSPGSYQVTSE